MRESSHEIKKLHLNTISQKLGVMKKFIQVRPENFDVEALMLAARDGRLYIDESSREVSTDCVKSDVRTYVERIRVFVTTKYAAVIDELWEQILTDDDFISFFTPGRKARKCRTFDKYNVIRVIGILRTKGVYEPYSDRRFMAELEQTDNDSSYRSYLGKGIELPGLLRKIRNLVTLNKL